MMRLTLFGNVNPDPCYVDPEEIAVVFRSRSGPVVGSTIFLRESGLSVQVQEDTDEIVKRMLERKGGKH